MEKIKQIGIKTRPEMVTDIVKSGKTRGEKIAEELTVIRKSVDLPASVHRAYVALELASKEKAAEIIKLIRGLR